MNGKRVMKFGGTSVASATEIKKVLEIVQDTHLNGHQPIVVLSAMSGMTNMLNALAEQARLGGTAFLSGVKAIETRHFDVVRSLIPISKQNPVLTEIRLMLNRLEDQLQGISSLQELSAQSRDKILSFGELLSTFLVSQIAANLYPSMSPKFVDARRLILTNSHFGQAAVREEETRARIVAQLSASDKHVYFVTGFIGADSEGRTTTLGRGGSDYTAALIGAALDAERIEIWTDVDGMMTADPRFVQKAYSLNQLSYAEAMELSYFGAKVIYPPTMLPAFREEIPIVIRNTFNPEFPGTFICHKAAKEAEEEEKKQIITGIASISEVVLIQLSGEGMLGKNGVLGRLFSLLSRAQVTVLLITQSSSEHSITFAIHPESLMKVQDLIDSEFELEIQANKLSMAEVERDLSVLAIVGEHMKRTPGVSGRLFHALGRNGINVRAIAQGSSELNISVIISKSDLSKALNAVHDAFFASLNKTLHVFFAGLGNIGATLLDQIAEQVAVLANYNDLEINVVGLTNSRSMCIDPSGIRLDDWRQEFAAKGEPADLESFLDRARALNLPNAIFVDNTASSIVANTYLSWFRSNISVVSSNKIANSSDMQTYRQLRDTARRHGVDFYYETNVGAGLPIVRVLKDIVLSGDRVVRVQAILSGTISYIFNNFTGEQAFHDVVRQAQELGYTEPDPRDDLNGLDFMRKMLIVARDAGYVVEADDVDLQQLLPPSCLKANTVAEFYDRLEAEAEYFDAWKQAAAAEGKVLRYIGELFEGKLSIRLETIGPDHPFFNLSGSDNIIAFTTGRYQLQPLVVKGPGAGASVTAAGVFADLVQVGARK